MLRGRSHITESAEGRGGFQMLTRGGGGWPLQIKILITLS